MHKMLKPEPCSLSSTGFIPNTCKPIFCFQVLFYYFPASLLLPPTPPSFIEMIFNLKSFIMIQAFIALIIIASSLTYSVNAAVIPPARQFLFLSLVLTFANFQSRGFPRSVRHG